MPMKRMAILAAVAATVPIFAARAQTILAPLPSGRAATEYYTNLPQADPGDDPANWSARQNVLDSRRYEQLVRTNPSFRAARIRQSSVKNEGVAVFRRFWLPAAR